MDTQITQRLDDNYHKDLISTDSAVSWPAVFAGAVASAALSLILLFLGTGFGLTLVSPWSTEGISVTSFGVSSILGITVISLIASALGGYLAGRLRTRWTNTLHDEVFFRDTAHGFLSWSVATLVTAALLTSVIGIIIGGGVKAGASVASGATSITTTNSENGNRYENPLPYLLDSLLRKSDAASSTNNAVIPQNSLDTAANTPQGTSQHNLPKGELTRIFINAVSTSSLPGNDLKYAGRLVAQYAEIDQQAAERRVVETFTLLQIKLIQAETEVKEAADKARKASAYSSLWLFISLLAGAFIASLMAVYGGRQRDL
jgi:hypothetical protein